MVAHACNPCIRRVRQAATGMTGSPGDSVRLCPEEVKKKTRQQQKDLNTSLVEKWNQSCGQEGSGRKKPLFFRDTVSVSTGSQDSGEHYLHKQVTLHLKILSIRRESKMCSTFLTD